MAPGPEKDGVDSTRQFIAEFELALQNASFDQHTINGIVAATLSTVSAFVIREMKASTKRWEDAITKLKHERH